jgi:hypothetical protein
MLRVQPKTIGDESWQPGTKAHKTASLPWGCLDYRHTFGSQLAQAGVSLYKIATLIENSPEICRRHYAAIAPEAKAGEVDFARAFRHQSITG